MVHGSLYTYKRISVVGKFYWDGTKLYCPLRKKRAMFYISFCISMYVWCCSRLCGSVGERYKFLPCYRDCMGFSLLPISFRHLYSSESTCILSCMSKVLLDDPLFLADYNVWTLSKKAFTHSCLHLYFGCMCTSGLLKEGSIK